MFAALSPATRISMIKAQMFFIISPEQEQVSEGSMIRPGNFLSAHFRVWLLDTLKLASQQPHPPCSSGSWTSDWLYPLFTETGKDMRWVGKWKHVVWRNSSYGPLFWILEGKQKNIFITECLFNIFITECLSVMPLY